MAIQIKFFSRCASPIQSPSSPRFLVVGRARPGFDRAIGKVVHGLLCFVKEMWQNLVFPSPAPRGEVAAATHPNPLPASEARGCAGASLHPPLGRARQRGAGSRAAKGGASARRLPREAFPPLPVDGPQAAKCHAPRSSSPPVSLA
jgi:hypothetical protein